MKTNKLSEMAKKDPSLYHRIGKLCTEVVQEIYAAKKSRDHEAERYFDSLGKQILEMIEKDDFALFEETEIEFQASRLV